MIDIITTLPDQEPHTIRSHTRRGITHPVQRLRRDCDDVVACSGTRRYADWPRRSSPARIGYAPR